MLEAIEKLLILQDRDRRIRRLEGELMHIGPERQGLKIKVAGVQAALENVKQHLRQIESERKRLELEVEAKKQMIERYSNQQLQTRKNEEYRALTHEIELCKADITKIEDQEIELMEQGEAAQKESLRLSREDVEVRRLVDEQVARLNDREQALQTELAQLEGNRQELASAVEAGARLRYDRLLKSKGENVVVGVHNGVCGGCHMRLPAQILVMCQAQQEIVSCTNCGRILYYTRDMVVAGED